MAVSHKLVCAVLLLGYICSAVQCAETTNAESNTVAEGRTFSHHFLKRLSFAVVPGAFVVGVITTLLAALTVVSMKGLGVGVILLVLAIGQMLSRTIGTTQAVAAYAAHPPAPVPIVYTHPHPQQPVWLEKDW